MAWMTVDERINPTDPRARIRPVDMVRGFALFGVLLVNMYNFGAYATEWDGVFDRTSFTVMHSVFETKSWRLFSLLFGFGFALQMLKAETQAASLGFYFRRLVILLLIGMAHTLFYDGDILALYAALGILLLVFRKLETRILLALVVLLLAVSPIGNAIFSAEQGTLELPTETAPTLAERRVGHPYLGTVNEVITVNATEMLRIIWKNPLGPESSIAVFAMFLLGLYVGRRRILHDIPQHLPLIRKACYWGLCVGIASAVAEWLLGYQFGYSVFRGNTAPTGIRFVGDILFVYGSTALAVGYGAGIVLLAHGRKWMSVLRLLENLGKMALTVYLSGTLMFTILFYGYGFGLYGTIPRIWQMGFVVAVVAFQLWFSPIWLQRFRFGPVEWLWRSLTYWKRQPMRRAIPV